MRHPPDDDPNEPLVELELHAVPDSMTLGDYHDRCLLVSTYDRIRDRLLKPRDGVIVLGEA